MTEPVTYVYDPSKPRKDPLDEVIYVDGDQIILNLAVEYYIDLQRCNTPEKILGWLVHLSEKTWIEKKHLVKFCKLAAKENKIEINYSM